MFCFSIQNVLYKGQNCGVLVDVTYSLWRGYAEIKEQTNFCLFNQRKE